MSHHDPIGVTGELVADKYKVERLVGEGGFAVVYRAQHNIWRKPVAIKFFNGLSTAPKSEREALLQEFIQEGALLTELSSQTAGIVQARDIGAYTTPAGEWMPYMVLEWLDGVPLDEVLYRDRQQGLNWSVEEVIGFLERVLPALQVAHSRGIAHRDLKPANLFVLGNAARSIQTPIKLLDFGVAKMVSDHAQQTAAQARTGTSITAFTPQYGAPEQFTRSYGATGPWTDVFAMALVAVEMLCGTEALSGDDTIQLGYSSADPKRRPTPRNLGIPVSDEVEALFLKALAIDPSQRYANAGAFLEAALEAIGKEPRVGSWPDRASVSEPAPIPLPQDRITPGTPPATTLGEPRRNRESKLPLIAVILIAVAGGTTVFAVSELEGAKETRDALLSVAKTAQHVASKLGIPRPLPSGTAQGSASPRTPALAPPVCPEGMLPVMATAGSKPLRFCLDQTEVTTQAYLKCVKDGDCKPAIAANWPGIKKGPRKLFSTLCSGRKGFRGPKKQALPINCVSWDMADRYCRAQNKRLPSVEEWTLAASSTEAQAGQIDMFKNGNLCDSSCTAWARRNGLKWSAYNDHTDGHATVAPSGSYAKDVSNTGHNDMLGNLAEWVDDPALKTGNQKRVMGEAWDTQKPSPDALQSGAKQAGSTQSQAIGFRCALSPKPSQ